MEARFRFDLYEMRLFLKMVSMVNQEDADFQVYRITLHDIVQDFELGNSGYERLRDAARKLMSKIITLYMEHDLGVMRFETPVVVGLGSFEEGVGERFIEISFHPNLKPHLLNLKNRFLLYDIRNILRLPSTYSIRMYELLKQYERIGKRRFSVDDLKDILGASENYPLYGNFKQRVIEKAKADLRKHTDISFTYEEKKAGRAVSELIFHIKGNTKEREAGQLAAGEEETHAPNPEVAGVLKKVSDWVSEEVVRDWLERYPLEQVNRGIAYTLNQLQSGVKIDNIGGYLAKMVSTRQLVDFKEKERNRVVEQVRLKEADDAMRARLEAKKTALMKAIAEEENLIIAEILGDEKIFNEVFEKVKNSRWGSFFEKDKTEIENYRSIMTIRATVNNEVKSRFPDRFSKLPEELELERINRELKGL